MNGPQKAVFGTVKILGPKWTLRRVLNFGQQSRCLHLEEAAPSRFLRHLAHVDYRDHRPRHTPHEFSDWQSIVCFSAPIDQFGEARRWLKAHREKCRAHISAKKRTMLLVV